MAYYRDLREYLATLEQAGKLVRVPFPVNKDTEIHPMVRVQFRGLKEDQRKAFLFENIFDVKGKQYTVPYAVCCMAGSTDIYALGMQCRPEEIGEKWQQAQLNPIKPVVVEAGEVQEEVHIGATLMEHGGLEEFPIPNSTPGYDNAPYLTAPYWVTKDPETGQCNVGTYRAQVKAPLRTGVATHSETQGLNQHWRKCRALGKPLEAAAVLGMSPNIAYVSTARLPDEVDEYDVAGGIAGTPVELVKAKTVDLLVPAHAEIVLEGIIPTDGLEPEAPFGEARGYMGIKMMANYFEIRCITHRKNPIYQGFLSQFPPSESTKLRCTAWQHIIRKYLVHDCGLPEVTKVVMHEATGGSVFCVVQMKKTAPEQSLRVMDALEKGARMLGKMAVIVDHDIDPGDMDAVLWALGRMMPHRDMRLVEGKTFLLDYSTNSSQERHMGGEPTFTENAKSSIVLIDTTMKWPYPPVSLPKREYMERALELWAQAGLPEPTLKTPWFGYPLGWWTDEDAEEADLAVRGEHYVTGEKARRQRKPV